MLARHRKMTNDRANVLWHIKTGEYCPEEVSVNGVVRFGKIDKTYIQRNSFVPRQLLKSTNHKNNIGGRTVRLETTLFLRQDPHAIAVFTEEAANDDLQQYLAGARYQRDAPLVAAFCPILLLVEYHDDDIFPLRAAALSPYFQIQKTISCSLRRRAGSLLRVILKDIVDPILLPLGNPIKCHKEVLSLQPMIPPKRFDISPPDWRVLRRSRCVQIFVLTQRRLRPIRQPFRSPTSGWRLPAPASWVELLVICSQATGQGLRRCSG